MVFSATPISNRSGCASVRRLTRLHPTAECRQLSRTCGWCAVVISRCRYFNVSANRYLIDGVLVYWWRRISITSSYHHSAGLACSSRYDSEASCRNVTAVTTGARYSAVISLYPRPDTASMATGGESSSSASSSAGGPQEHAEDRFMMCVLCLGRCDPHKTLSCGCWHCFNCVVRLVDTNSLVPCSSCRTANDALPTPIRKLPQFNVNGSAAARAERANAICESAAPQRVVITHVTPRPPLTDVSDERRRTETAQMLVRKRGAHTHTLSSIAHQCVWQLD